MQRSFIRATFAFVDSKGFNCSGPKVSLFNSMRCDSACGITKGAACLYGCPPTLHLAAVLIPFVITPAALVPCLIRAIAATIGAYTPVIADKVPTAKTTSITVPNTVREQDPGAATPPAAPFCVATAICFVGCHQVSQAEGGTSLKEPWCTGPKRCKHKTPAFYTTTSSAGAARSMGATPASATLHSTAQPPSASCGTTVASAFITCLSTHRIRGAAPTFVSAFR